VPRGIHSGGLLPGERGLRAQELRKCTAERRSWLQAHGIDPDEWSKVYPILRVEGLRHPQSGRPGPEPIQPRHRPNDDPPRAAGPPT
jgi:hypothetical protein